MRNHSKGLTLVEVLVSMSLLCIGILSIITVYPVMFQNIQNSWTTARMTFLAQEVMDRLLADNVFIDIEKVKVSVIPDPEAINPVTANIPLDKDGKPIATVEYWGEPPQPVILPRTQVIHVEVTWEVNKRKRTHRVSGSVMP